MGITHSLPAQHLMEDERDSADILHSGGPAPGGSGSEFKLSAKLRARMEKLEKWRMPPSSIRSPKDARQCHGGHATVSKAFMIHVIGIGQKARHLVQSCRQSPKPDDHIRGAADDRREAGGELDEEEKDEEEELEFDSDDLWLGEFVAVKKSRIADNKDLVRVLGLALRETEFLAELSHPNVVKLKGFVEDASKDIIWLVFPWADNGNLKDFVASRDWEIPERISLIKDVASGLEYLHSREPPICHGDLKSFNVLVDSEHVALITDFGSARRLTEHGLNRQPGLISNQQLPVQAKFSTLSKTITLTGNIYTLRWAAPELLNDDQISLWSDIWALGWIAYEVLTNSIPFQDVPADAVVVERVIKGDLPSIDEDARVSLFEKLCTLMTMCWNSNPSERPTAQDYARAVSDMPMVVPNLTNSGLLVRSASEALMTRGRTALRSDDLGMAFACFTEARQIYTRVDNSGRFSAMCGLAEVHRLRNQDREAFALYSEVLQIRTDIGDRQSRADALWGLAEMHRARNEYSEAIALYSEVLQIRTDIGDRQSRADALWGLAEVHRARNEYSEAIPLYSEVLKIRTDIGNRKGRANALEALAYAHRARNEYSERNALYSEELQIFADIGDKQGRADALLELADVHRLRDEYREAFALYSEVLQIRTDIGDRQGRASALWCLASVHRLRNEHSEAIALYSEALQIRTESGDRKGRADALCDLAEVHRLRGEYSEAIALYSEVLQIRTDIGDRKGRANALWGLAGVHRDRNEYSMALALYSQSLQMCTDIDDKKGRAYALKGLADIYCNQNHHDYAISLYEQAAAIFEQSGNRDAAADMLKEAADARRRLKPVEAA